MAFHGRIAVYDSYNSRYYFCTAGHSGGDGQHQVRPTAIGDGGKVALIRAIRRHGNFAENAGIFAAGLVLGRMLISIGVKAALAPPGGR